MTADDAGRPTEAGPAELLNRYLDDLARGAPAPPTDLDPLLAATVRQIHDLADITVAANVSGADEAQTWEDLMQIQPRPSVVAFPAVPAAPPSAARPRPTHPRASGLRRLGSSTVGLVASLTLLVLVGAAALAVYLTAPGDNADPTSLPAAFGTTPEPETPPTTGVAPVFGTADDGTAYARAAYADCTVTPASYEDVMETVVGDAIPFDGVPPQPQIATVQPGPNGTAQYFFDQLPDGGPVSQEIIEAAMRTYSLYLGCEDTPLHWAPLFTDRGLFREYWETPSIYLQDGGADGHRLAALWSDYQGRQSVDEEHIGKLSWAYLYDFRTLPDGNVAAYLSGNSGVAPDALPDFYMGAGYVVFAEQDGQWLIDEQFRQ